MALTHTYYYIRQWQCYSIIKKLLIGAINSSVGLSAGLQKKVREGFGLNFQGRLDLVQQHKVCKILVVIGIGVQIQDWIFAFFTIAR